MCYGRRVGHKHVPFWSPSGGGDQSLRPIGVIRMYIFGRLTKNNIMRAGADDLRGIEGSILIEILLAPCMCYCHRQEPTQQRLILTYFLMSSFIA